MVRSSHSPKSAFRGTDGEMYALDPVTWPPRRVLHELYRSGTGLNEIVIVERRFGEEYWRFVGDE
jgi:hypothetical protein